MAKPRVFVSSTYYDLKHVRASLETFIDSLGFDAVLSEKGDIAFAPDVPLDQSCYREVSYADIFVLVVGGRYGSEKSNGSDSLKKEFYERYDSITKQEYRAAVEKDIPIYILIEKAVYSDYETYLRNKDSKSINYAHVDSVNIFGLIEEILAQPRNNPVQQFDRYGDVEAWLREQWAGLFRELLNRTSSQKQIASLAAQVASLAEINTTLKTYLEQVVKNVAPAESARIINSESRRLEEATRHAKFAANDLVSYLGAHRMSLEAVQNAVRASRTLEGFVAKLKQQSGELDADQRSVLDRLENVYRKSAERDLNDLRLVIGLGPLLKNTFNEASDKSHTVSESPASSEARKPRKKARSEKVSAAKA